MSRELILGTAGHIDHGKTALVQALTGVDTDRLHEEKERGISIEIGFAHLDLEGDLEGGAPAGPLRLGIVDLPGHERFVRNMLAGACGVDVALLVVAADDSVMPQTREHLAILRLLEVEHGLVVVTKTDLVEPAWLDLVEDDVRELVRGTFLETAPVVRTSVRDGSGVETLRATLARTCRAVAARPPGVLFRLAVDRSFVLQGLGTVVTGTVWSGRASVGDELDWLGPRAAGRGVRVRGIQTHGRDAETVERGQRAALNLTGAHHTEIGRGDVLATPGFLKASRRLTARVDVLADSPWPLRHRGRVRLHVGTAEVMARVLLLRGTVVAPGASGLAQIACDEPVAAVARQPFVLRAESPVRTIGGGRVLQPAASRIARRRTDLHEHVLRLDDDDETARAAAAVLFHGAAPATDLDLCRDADIAPDRVAAVRAGLEADGVVVTLAPGTRHERRVHRDFLAAAGARVLDRLRRLHAAAPLEMTVPVRRLGARLPSLEPEVLAAVLAWLRETGRVAGDERAVALPDFRPALSEAQTRLLATVLERYQSARFGPPDPGEIAESAGVTAETIRPIIELCVGQRELAHVHGSLYLHREWEHELRRIVTDRLADGSGCTVSEIKDLLGTSRKYAVPLCEYLDRVGVTKRKDDLRVLARLP
jgi:selenocysteine-specific elongation factor